MVRENPAELAICQGIALKGSDSLVIDHCATMNREGY